MRPPKAPPCRSTPGLPTAGPNTRPKSPRATPLDTSSCTSLAACTSTWMWNATGEHVDGAPRGSRLCRTSRACPAPPLLLPVQGSPVRLASYLTCAPCREGYDLLEGKDVVLQASGQGMTLMHMCMHAASHAEPTISHPVRQPRAWPRHLPLAHSCPTRTLPPACLLARSLRRFSPRRAHTPVKA